MAERRLKVARIEQAQLQRSLAPLANNENTSIKITTDMVDGANDARTNNLLLPPSNVFYNNSRLAPTDTTTTVIFGQFQLIYFYFIVENILMLLFFPKTTRLAVRANAALSKKKIWMKTKRMVNVTIAH